MAIPISGAVRVGAAEDYASGDYKAAINNRGELLVAQGLPSKADLARLKLSWYTAIPTGSAFTPVAAMPTTRSELSIRNGYTDDTCLLIELIGTMSLTSLAAASGATIVAQVNDAAALTDNTAVLISGNSGGVYSGSVTRALATTTAVANKWLALDGMPAAGGTATIGAGLVAKVNGGLVIKPGFTLHTNTVFSTAAGTAIMWVAWHEVKLDYV